MGDIHIMTPELVGRIAAGEVVERPASVVKELVENAMDAGATFIRVNVEQGGHKLIQVTDNGCGMDRADALLCLETHATSKISSDGDVGHIATLGFRGEALPSIASVSRFILQTRRKEKQAGTEVTVDFGNIRDARDCGCAPGTNIRVAQLFANLPARRKFLKGPDTEDGYIEEMVRLLALARPDVSIVLNVNGREQLRANGTQDLGTRVSSILGRDMFSAMIPLQYTENSISVTGFITKPGFTRSSRREQRVIINGRAATADTIFFAIRDSFDSLIMKGRYPGAVIYIQMPPDGVDVNVHPTKREVRFRDQREVGQVVSAAIRRALRGMPGGEEINYATRDAFSNAPLPDAPPPLPQPPPPIAHDLPLDTPQPVPAVPPPYAPSLPLTMPPHPPVVPNANPPLGGCQGTFTTPAQQSVRSTLQNLRYIGRLGRSYALADGESGLVVVNLRAAHQRIIFERLLAGMNARQVPSQQLLMPVTLALGPDDARFMRTEAPRFSQLGFQIEPFGGNTFIVAAVPAAFPNEDVSTMLHDIIDELRQSSVTTRQSTIHLAQTACRHAISSSEKLTDQEVNTLLQSLAATDMPYACPNGHPTMVHITFAELEKRFQQ